LRAQFAANAGKFNDANGKMFLATDETRIFLTRIARINANYFNAKTPSRKVATENPEGI
jgi:hypothetical protein